MTPPAYIVLAHRLPHQLGRLARALGPESPILVHVDARVDAAPFAAAVRGLRNVELLRRHRVRWAGWGHVAATLEGIAAIVDGAIACDHVALLTVQDFPLRAPDAIAGFLAQRAGTSYLMHAPLPVRGWEGERGGRDRYERSWLHVAGRHVSLPWARAVPGGLRLHGGSGYWCLAREHAAWLLAETRRRPEIIRFFRHVRAPDEMFAHTLLLSGPHARGVANDPLRYIDFAPGAAHPRTLTAADLPALRALPPNALWARKFDEGQDGAVLDALEAGFLAR